MAEKKALQRFCGRIGSDGCYFLSVVYWAEVETGKKIDVLDAYENALAAGAIDEACFVLDAGKLASLLTGERWEARHESADYVCRDGEREITRFENRSGGNLYSHFVPTENGKVLWDPLGDSVTVRDGSPASKRILWRV